MAPKLQETLATLIAEQKALTIRCGACARHKTLSPLEAVVSYGGLLTFLEVKALIHARCRKRGCQAEVGKA